MSPGIGLVYGNFVLTDESGNHPRSGRIKRLRGQLPAEVLFDGPCGCTSTVILRKECFEAIGLFDERLRAAKDVNMWSRVAALWAVEYSSDVVAKCERRAGSVTENRTLMKGEFLKHSALFYERFKRPLKIPS